MRSRSSWMTSRQIVSSAYISVAVIANWPIFLKAHGRPHDAIAAHRQAKKYFDSLPSDHPSQSYYRSMAAHTNSDLGELLVSSGQSEEGGNCTARRWIHLPSWLQSFQRTWGTSATWRSASGVSLPRSVTVHLQSVQTPRPETAN